MIGVERAQFLEDNCVMFLLVTFGCPTYSLGANIIGKCWYGSWLQGLGLEGHNFWKMLLLTGTGCATCGWGKECEKFGVTVFREEWFWKKLKFLLLLVLEVHRLEMAFL